MQFSISLEYAMHYMLHMVDIPSVKSVGIKDLAEYQGVSETEDQMRQFFKKENVDMVL